MASNNPLPTRENIAPGCPAGGQHTPTHNPFEGLTIKDDHLLRVLQGAEFLVQDGAMGTMLQAAGLAGQGSVPDLLCLTNPEDITAIHAAYVQAGAEMVTTNTFGANAHKLGSAATVAEVYAAAADCARAAGARYVAGDIGPTGMLLEPMGTTTFQEAYDLFAEQVRAAASAGCDIIVFETMSDLREMKAAILAAKENCTLPIFATMTFEEDGRTFLGTPPEVAAITLSSLGAHAIGLNCSLGPAEMAGMARTLLDYARCPVIIRPNAGLPRMVGDETVFDITPEAFGQAMEEMIEAGASILGGCCGTNPQFIAKLSSLAQRFGTPVARSFTPHCALTSAQEAVVFPSIESPRIAVIGERINPTGKPKLKDALRRGDLDYIIGQAVEQQSAGADVLDVNVGLPELDEPVVLEAAVQKLQASITLPLVIDSSDPEAIEAAVRTYAGKPLINSVNGKQSNMDAVLPLAKKYGCAVIGLTLDEDGIPSTAEARVAIARRIVEAAEAIGIPRQDVVIDCLTMAAATNQKEAVEILRALRLVKSELGVRTVLGVSNISFGLPQRMLMNSTFLSTAFGAGLDMPIINPNSARYRDVVLCHKVINGQDENAVAYIQHTTDHPDPYEAKAAPAASGQAETSNAQSAQGAGASEATQNSAPAVPIPESLASSAEDVRALQEYILTGRAEPVTALTEKLLASHDALEIIDGLFIPTLDEVGVRFEKGTFFLPQLMTSAEAVKAGFDVVKAHMGEAEQADASKGIILATVEGDIHDIGKNIVKMLLENYGYYVVDLGRDVPPARVVEAAKEHGITLVGLSALMTTTVKSMEKTIALLREEVPDAKVFVGGAVLTPEYAKQMGADFYAKDAAESARIAEGFFDQ